VVNAHFGQTLLLLTLYCR